MHVRKLPGLEVLVFGVALITLVLDAGGGPGWGVASARAAVAVHLDRSAAAPLYDVLAGVAARLPLGEPGFRLSLLGALLGAATLAGVVAASRALLPKDPLAGVVAAIVLVVAPPLRDAVGFASPAALAACGIAWAIACTLRHVRSRAPIDAIAGFGACALVVGSAPWLGAALVIVVAAWQHPGGKPATPPRWLLATFAALAAFVVVMWLGAAGSLPSPHASLATALAETGRGAAAIVVGAGLLGIGFGALTGLAGARGLAIVALVAAAHELFFPGFTAPLLASFAIGVAILAGAIARASQLEGGKRALVALAAGIPLLGASFATGATITIDDPGATPSRLVGDLENDLPAGPGVFVATRSTTYFAAAYEAAVAGVRPDLALVPPMPPTQADAIVADSIRAGRVAGADAAAFGRLDVRRSVPRGRGFQLVGELPAQASPVDPPATYATAIGEQQAVLLSLERARIEAASGRLDTAARAAGLESRFGAADLAVLAATVPTKDRPALFGFLPLDVEPAGHWLVDVFGDDLAWVAGIPQPPLPPTAPLARRLHERWRALLLGKISRDDASIAALGARAIAATDEMLKELR